MADSLGHEAVARALVALGVRQQRRARRTRGRKVAEAIAPREAAA